MEHRIIHLKDYFPFLGQDGRDATAEVYLQYNMTEMERQKRKRPVMIVCPGGGYGMCSQREAEPIAMSFLPDGFNVFTLTYSVLPHHYPAQLQEVAALIELIYNNSDEWNCDTDKIAIIGFSAGGHLAAHYSNAYDCPEVREVFSQSKPVNAAILAYPVITTDPQFGHLQSFFHLTGKEILTPEEIEKFSCEKLVSGKTPPTYLYHMAADALVPAMNTVVYAQALLHYQIPCEVHIYPHGYHGTATCDAQTADNLSADALHSASWLNDARAWLKYMGIAY